MDAKQTYDYLNDYWKKHVIPTLSDYVKIPNVSPSFDPEWNKNGLLQKAAHLLLDWAKKQDVQGLKAELVELPNRTPLIFITIESSNDKSNETVLMYGHLDKQPPLTETWEKGLHPYEPIIRDGKLYGRGSSDDGYAIFAALTAIKALQTQGIPHTRIVVMIEASEESGSPDLPAYVEHLQERIGTPSLIVCLDSGCGNYEQFWLTASLRGLFVANLKVSIIKEGVHSGHGSGIVADTFRISRMLLSRLEDETTGHIKPDFLYCEVPSARLEQTQICADALGTHIHEEFPFVSGGKPVSHDLKTLLLNRNWKPQLTITGADGIPSVEKGGNVLRQYTTLKLSLRLPPRVTAKDVAPKLKELFEKDPPYGAQVTLEVEKASAGWDAPETSAWLNDAISKASQTFYQKKANWSGEGGSIPFMGMLGEKYPKAQFVITGVLGPGSNAHGPNEFLHIDFAVKVTCCVSSILSDHFKHFQK